MNAGQTRRPLMDKMQLDEKSCPNHTEKHIKGLGMSESACEDLQVLKNIEHKVKKVLRALVLKTTVVLPHTCPMIVALRDLKERLM